MSAQHMYKHKCTDSGIMDDDLYAPFSKSLCLKFAMASYLWIERAQIIEKILKKQHKIAWK